MVGNILYYSGYILPLGVSKTGICRLEGDGDFLQRHATATKAKITKHIEPILPPELMRPLTEALLTSTVDNVLAMGPAQALTGPAARGDTAVVQAQGEVVKRWNAPAGELYQTLSELAAQLKKDGKTRV